MKRTNNYYIDDVFHTLIERYGKDIKTELNYENNYQLLIAIMLSAQTTDQQVNKITGELFDKIHQPIDAIKLGIDGINMMIKNINYHNNKAKYIYQMSRQIIDNFNNVIPDDFQKLILLSGVGRKTANVFLSIAFNKNTIGVDTHVFRVSNRLLGINAKNPFETEKILSKIISTDKYSYINNLFIPFGREYCKAKKPLCFKCPLSEKCKKYNKKGYV